MPIWKVAVTTLFRRAWLNVLGALLTLTIALLLTSTPLNAGTVTIVHDPDTTPPDPTNAVYTDGYIQDYLNTTGSLVIDTADSSVGAVDELRVEPDVLIQWSNGNQLTLTADADIVVSGTIQHDGPVNGSGGVTLLANRDGVNGGDVWLGTGAQATAIEVGSRHGLTRVDGENIHLRAGAGATDLHVLLGFLSIDMGSTYSVTGAISVTATMDVTALGGSDTRDFVQVGHGGGNSAAGTDDGTLTGEVTIVAGNTISFTTGEGSQANAVVGNGGGFSNGTFGGGHTLRAIRGDIRIAAPHGSAYTQIGNGGGGSGLGDSATSGDHTVTAGHDILLSGGDAIGAYVLVGNGGAYFHGSHNGSHSLTAQTGDIRLRAGEREGSFAQIGNGGFHADGDHSGDHTLFAAADISLAAGRNPASGGSYAQVGNGGGRVAGNSIGNVTMTAQTGDITASGADGLLAYVQVGNGGGAAAGNYSGDQNLTAGNDIFFQAGWRDQAYAQVGNGGISTIGNHSGGQSLTAGGSISFLSGFFDGTLAYAQVGNGGSLTLSPGSGNLSGDQSLVADGSISFQGSVFGAYAQVGNGGEEYDGNHSGDQRLVAGGSISFRGDKAYAQVGNGGYNIDGTLTGNQYLTSVQGIAVSVGVESAASSYALVGNGGALGSGDRSGNIELDSDGLIVIGGSDSDSFVQLGHGGNGSSGAMTGTITVTAETAIGLFGGAPAQIGHGDALMTSTGARSGDITVVAGTDLTLVGGRIGHATDDGVNAITNANTLIAVGQDDPDGFPGGTINATNSPMQSVAFSSAPATNGGELRFYVPSLNNVTIPAGTPMNSEHFPGTVPPARAAGLHLFANGPYIPDYSFYVAGVADLGVAMQAEPGETLLPGQPVTYTLTFSNSGAFTATNVVLTSTLAPELSGVTFDSALDPGVTLTQTGSSPTVTWAVSELGPDAGGVITISAQISTDVSAVSSILNAGEITGTLDITPTNNSNEVANSVEPPVVSFAQANASISENDGNVVLELTLDPPNPYAAISLAYASSDGSAEAGSDYTTVSDTLTIPAGQTSAVIDIALVDDDEAEADELFSVTLTSATGARLGAIPAAFVTIVNDDEASALPALRVSKEASVPLARVGESITYTYRITNSGGVPFTALVAVDSLLGAVPLDKNRLELGEVAMGQLTYTVKMNDLASGLLVNRVTVTGTPAVGNSLVVTADAGVEVVNAAFSFSKTVGIQNIQPQCTAVSTIQVPVSTTVVYCYTVTNTGSETLTRHTLVDDQLGTVLDGVEFDLAPGATFSTTLTRTLFTGVTNLAVWSASYAGSDDTTGSLSIAALPAQSDAQATVNISDDDDDQDGDKIPDNVEQATDPDEDNTPNFLDTDSDDDGRLDSVECSTLPCRDSNSDGTPDFLDPNEIAKQPLYLPFVEH